MLQVTVLVESGGRPGGHGQLAHQLAQVVEPGVVKGVEANHSVDSGGTPLWRETGEQVAVVLFAISGCGLIEKEGPNGELGGRCQEYASVKACLATCVASHDRDNYVSTSVSLVPA